MKHPGNPRSVGSPHGADVLSRLAGSVFHVGNAVERTDVVARMLDVYVARGEPASAEQDRMVAAELRAVVGAAGPANDPDRAATIDSLALDRHESASIASAVAVARDHARRAREVVSTELWDCLNVTRSRMPRKVAPDRAHEFLGWVRERSAWRSGSSRRTRVVTRSGSSSHSGVVAALRDDGAVARVGLLDPGRDRPGRRRSGRAVPARRSSAAGTTTRRRRRTPRPSCCSTSTVRGRCGSSRGG